MSATADRGALAFAEKLLGLLGEGSFNATYKYAVLLALTDLCLEGSTRSGSAPTSVSTPQLAEKIVELYWPHTLPFKADQVLQQNNGGQASILTRIARFRAEDVGDPSATLQRARLSRPVAFARMLRDVEWRLVLMPLPKLQRIGDGVHAFIYEIAWDDSVRRGQFNSDGFDNLIRFKPGAGEHLVRLAGLIRPLVQREWASLVARFNGLERAELDDFLFGARRIALGPLRGDLSELQNGRCFYCDGRMTGRSEVDHFVPWSRYPDDAVGNLVVAHGRCNNAKRDHLASAAHVEAWTQRSIALASDLEGIASRRAWDWHPARTASVARSIYLRLPEDARLWQEAGLFVAMERERLVEAFGRVA